MKKFIPVLAVTALLATGCTNKAQIKESAFKKEITDYGFALENNAQFKGEGRMGLSKVTLNIQVDSIGKQNKMCKHTHTHTHQYQQHQQGNASSSGLKSSSSRSLF